MELFKKKQKEIPQENKINNPDPIIASSGENETGEQGLSLENLLQNLFERVSILEQTMLKYLVQDNKEEGEKDETEIAPTEE